MAAKFSYDHIHLRSRDIVATASFYEDVFEAKRIGETLSGEQPRIDLSMYGTRILISKASGDNASPAALSPCFGIDHFGFIVSDIDDLVQAMKAKGVVFVREPANIRPGIRISFLRAPDGVTIELIDRNAG